MRLREHWLEILKPMKRTARFTKIKVNGRTYRTLTIARNKLGIGYRKLYQWLADGKAERV